MKLKNIPIEQLHISKLNMRHGRKTPHIDDIYPSIRDDGVFQTLLVRKEGKGFGVIAGRRRFFALRKAAKETGKKQVAPCGVMDAGDNARAIEASLLENIARLPAGEFQQYDAFARLAAQHKTAEDIAETFGITPLKVRRILALANLKPDIKALYEDDKIAIPTLRAMTLASDDQQDAWLELFHSEDEYAPEGERLKAWLTGGARIKTETALFDTGTYDGTIITDLFADTGYFADPDLFWTHQNVAIAANIEKLTKDGWQDVTIMERGDHFASWEYGKRNKTEGGKVFVEVKHDGTVKFHEGYLTLADIKKIDAVLKGEASIERSATTRKPELTGPLTDYIELHRLAAIRSSLLDHPSIALRLTVAHMLVGSELWSVAPDPLTSRKEKTAESVGTSVGAGRVYAERQELFDLLDIEAVQRDYGRPKAIAYGDATDLFAKLLEMDDETVMRVMTLAMAVSLKSGSQTVEAVALTIPVDMAELWQPDEAFFSLLRDKRVINAMVADIAGDATAKAHLTDTAKKQREIILNRIAGNSTKPAPDWRPCWMRPVPSSYLKDKKCSVEACYCQAETILKPKKQRKKNAA